MRTWLVVIVLAGCGAPVRPPPAAHVDVAAIDAPDIGPGTSCPSAIITDTPVGSMTMTATGPVYSCRFGPSPAERIRELVRTSRTIGSCLETVEHAGSVEVDVAIAPTGEVRRTSIVDRVGDPEIERCIPALHALAAPELACAWRTTVTLTSR